MILTTGRILGDTLKIIVTVVRDYRRGDDVGALRWKLWHYEPYTSVLPAL